MHVYEYMHLTAKMTVTTGVSEQLRHVKCICMCTCVSICIYRPHYKNDIISDNLGELTHARQMHMYDVRVYLRVCVHVYVYVYIQGHFY